MGNIHHGGVCVEPTYVGVSFYLILAVKIQPIKYLLRKAKTKQKILFNIVNNWLQPAYLVAQSLILFNYNKSQSTRVAKTFCIYASFKICGKQAKTKPLTTLKHKLISIVVFLLYSHRTSQNCYIKSVIKSVKM